MANSKSALKRVRQNKRRTDQNKTLRTKVKSLRKTTVEAAEAGKAEEAQATLKELASAVDRAQKKGLFHKNKAANLKSKAVKALKAASA
jgi:small subunit ribosomal protein S20